MITELRMAYRHLREVELRDLKGVSIIVGPNNAGKTSIFRGVQYLTGKQRASNSEYLTLGTRIEVQGATHYRVDENVKLPK